MAVLGLLLLVASLLETQADASKVSIAVYYEALCPDSEQFVLQQLRSTYTQLKDYMNVELIPYGNAEHSGEQDHYKFTCQHGPEECYGNMVQTCYMHFVNNTAEQIKFVSCAFKSPSQRKSLDRCVDSDDLKDKIKQCVSGPLGPNLEYVMAKKTEALRPRHTFIPWITVNGRGSREITDSAFDDLVSVVCNNLSTEKPDLCSGSKFSILRRFRSSYF